MSIDERLRLCILFDNYGALLTERQREVFGLHFNDDLSFGEISERLGISRPAVVDHLRRAESFLRDTEEKLGHSKKLQVVEAGVSRSLKLLAELRGLALEAERPDWAKIIDEAISALSDTGF